MKRLDLNQICATIQRQFVYIIWWTTYSDEAIKTFFPGLIERGTIVFKKYGMVLSMQSFNDSRLGKFRWISSFPWAKLRMSVSNKEISTSVTYFTYRVSLPGSENKKDQYDKNDIFNWIFIFSTLLELTWMRERGNRRRRVVERTSPFHELFVAVNLTNHFLGQSRQRTIYRMYPIKHLVKSINIQQTWIKLTNKYSTMKTIQTEKKTKEH